MSVGKGKRTSQQLGNLCKEKGNKRIGRRSQEHVVDAVSLIVGKKPEIRAGCYVAQYLNICTSAVNRLQHVTIRR